MAIFPVATAAQLLGIHPKTLHHWLGEANFSLAPHATDARIKCVAQEHLLELARRHGRPLPDLPSAPRLPGLSAPGSPEEQATPWPANEVPPAALLSVPCASEADLIQRLAGLETRIVTLQEHLAQLALALLQERERTVESRIAALEALVQPLVGRHVLADLPGPEAEQASACASPAQRQLLPAEQRARSRMPALIEYGAQGTYVIITSQEGEMHLLPDSPEWFEWLATISSFRFVGQQGRFTAHRDTKHRCPTRSWRAYRTIHQRNYKLSLGITDDLTLACLEQAAATFQAHVPAL
jgi:DNA-binding transcriptional MerR regulator